jgi:hypothetical protein
LIADELVEVGVGEHFAPALLAMPQGDVVQRSGRDVTVERLGGAAELGRRLGLGAQTIRRPNVWLVLAGRWRHEMCGGRSERGADGVQGIGQPIAATMKLGAPRHTDALRNEPSSGTTCVGNGHAEIDIDVR